jgi:serine protease Do
LKHMEQIDFARRTRALTIAALLYGVTFSACLVPAAGAQEKKAGRASLNLLQDAFASIAEELEPAVVTVTSKKTYRPKTGAPAPRDEEDFLFNSPLGRGRSPRAFRSQGTGSGVIISTDGWILTNDHVISGADKVTVKLQDGREFDGTVRRDYRSDLALVKITASDLHAARLGDSDKTKIGHWAIAIGSPFRYEGSFSVGVISSLYRKQQISGGGDGPGRLYPSMIQTDAAINPGNSGGPLVNIDGEVIGINTAIESDTGGSVGIGFAIPINIAKFVIEGLKATGHVQWGYLGIEPESITPRLAAAYKVSNGAYVKGDPFPDTPAAKAGIQAGDVIVEVDQKPIKSELDLRSTVSRIAPGRTIEIVLVRAGIEKHVKATIEEAPAMLRNPAGEAPAKATLGLEVTTITPEAAKKTGLDEKAQGVVVKNVDGGSAAFESEISPGDIILKVNGTPTTSIEAFKKATEGVKSGDVVRILFAARRGATTLTREIPIIVD